MPTSLPRVNEISVSWGVLLFALGAAVIAGIIFGIAPAFHARRVDITHALKQEGRAATGSREQIRSRRLLVVSEIALSLVLVSVASLLLRSFWDLAHVRLGFDPDQVMTVRTRLPSPNDPTIDKYAGAAQEAHFVRELVRRCAVLPGVEKVAVGDTASIPLDESLRDLKLVSEGQFLLKVEGRETRTDQSAAVDRSSVTPDYFYLLGIPLVQGRLFNASDTDRTPQVAVINQAMAQRYWPDEDPLGKRFRSVKPNSPWIAVIGVLANARTQSLAQADVPEIYFDLYQTGAQRLAMLLRGHLNAAAIPEEVRKQVQAVDPTLPVYGAQTLRETVSDSLAQRRFTLELVTMFGLTALFLAALGIYGVISYLVSERSHEIGIRRALGAQNRNILELILRQGIGLAFAGATLGLLCALVVSRLMSSVLFGVKPHDPAVFLSVPFSLTYRSSHRELPARPPRNENRSDHRAPRRLRVSYRIWRAAVRNSMHLDGQQRDIVRETFGFAPEF